MKNKTIAAIAAAGAALALVSAADAKPKKNEANQMRWDERQQMWVQQNFTPPGLAKKPGGMPPGQYKKLQQQQRSYDYRVGSYLPSNYYTNRNYEIANGYYNGYGLRTPPAGYEWIRVDNDAYLAQSRTGLIAQVIADLFR